MLRSARQTEPNEERTNMAPDRPRKLGLQLPEAERSVRWSELRQMAKLAEQIGFDSLWVGDHLLYLPPGQPPKGPWEAWSVLAALAEATERVELAPLVACTAFHNPAIIAKKAATIDEISNGRLILGLGAGWNLPDFQPFGFPFDHRVGRFEEAFTIIRTLLADGEVDFHGEYYDLPHCILTPNGPRGKDLPLLVGSVGERMLRATLPYVDAWNVWFEDFENDPLVLREVIARVDRIAADVDRDPATFSHSVALLVGVLGATSRPSVYPSKGQTPISGSAAEIAAKIEAFYREGVDHIQIVLTPITLEAIETLAPVVEQLNS
jgi:alkanesulfonate monooxygenase SsuD/methylene tetrahydromethanopterin reductase-like flavin-dependent oxidoreductase (luciferase family)